MYDEFQNCLPEELSGNFSKVSIIDDTIEYGFNTLTTLKYSTRFSADERRRRGHWLGNRVGLYGNYNVSLFRDVGFNDGINTKYMSAQVGRFVEEDYAQDFVKMRKDKTQAHAFAMAIASDVYSKNMIAPLVYALLDYYTLVNGKNLEYVSQADAYNNGHVKITNGQLYGEAAEDHARGKHSVVTDRATISRFHYDDGRDGTTRFAQKDDIVVLYDKAGYSPKQLALIRTFFSGTRALSPLSTAVSRPRLVNDVYINSPIPVVMEDHDLFLPHDIIEVLTRLVTDNHLQTDFHYAYGIVASMLLTPKPRTAESAAWIKNGLTLRLPVPSFNAGVDPVLLLGGMPYVKDMGTMTTIHKWASTPGTMLDHACVFVESVYVQLSVVIKASYDAEVTPDNFVEKATSHRATGGGGLVTDAALLAMRMGRELELPYALQAGVVRTLGVGKTVEIDYEVTITDVDAPKFYNLTKIKTTVPKKEIMVDKYVPANPDQLQAHNANLPPHKALKPGQLMVLTKVPKATSKEWKPQVGETAALRVTSLPPLMYSIYTYGVNPDVQLGNEMSSSVVVDAPRDADGRIIIYDLNVFIKFMDHGRMAGWDILATEVYSGKRIHNWADNATGRYIYDHTGEFVPVQFAIHPHDITERKNCWIQVPTFSGPTTLTYSMLSKVFSQYNGKVSVNGEMKRSKLIRTGFYFDAKKLANKAKMSDRITGFGMGVQFLPLRVSPESDFHRPRLTLTGLTDVKAPSFQSQTASIQQHQDQEPTNDQSPMDVVPTEGN